MTQKGAGRRAALIAAEGIAANFLLGTLFIWSVLRNPLLELFPAWNEGMLSVIFGIHNLFTCLGVFLGGKLSERFSNRTVFFLCAALVLAGLGGFSLLPAGQPALSYALAFSFFCFFAATGIGLGINAVQSATIPWFPKHAGLISGALYMSLGFSSVLLSLLASRTLPVLGVRLTMLLIAVLVFAAAVLILCDRRSITPPPAAQAAVLSGGGSTPGEMLRSGTFWLLLVWNVCLRTAGLTLLDYAASIAVAFGGTAVLGMLISPANGLGSLSIGTLLDRVGKRRAMALCAGLLAAAGGVLLTGCRNGALGWIVAGLLLGGLGYGGSSSTYSASIRNEFGALHFSRNFGISNIAMGCAAVLEPLSGFLLDRTGGDYTAVAAMVLLFALPAAACVLPRRRMGKPVLPPPLESR